MCFVDKGSAGRQYGLASQYRTMPKWRNWQTRYFVLVLAREWRFESSLGHHTNKKSYAVAAHISCSSPFWLVLVLMPVGASVSHSTASRRWASPRCE